MEGKNYSSTRFIPLTDTESITNAKKKYIIWIIIMTLFCVTVGYFSYKAIAPTLFMDKNEQLSSNFIPSLHSCSVNLYNPKKFLESFKLQDTSTKSDFICEESQRQLKAIPSVFITSLLQERFDNIHSYINLDILLHYEYIINKYKVERLKLIFNEYQLNLVLAKKSKDFIKFLKGLKSIKFQLYEDCLKREYLNLEFIKLERYFALTEELNHWYNYLHLLRKFLSGYEQQKLKQYLGNITVKNFEKYTEETQKRLFHFVYSFNLTDKKLEEINSVVSEWAEDSKIEVSNSSVIFYNKAVILSEINRKIQELKLTTLKEVFVFASHIVYLDKDVELSGVNLAVIAPKWVFLKKIKINLDGVIGKEYKNTTANLNEPGKPGFPGGSGGNFLGVGNLHEKYLFVSADGGRGGSGQNGAKGNDGVDNTRPEPPVNRPACMAKINSFNNSFGQMITHYKVYNRAGCGGSGSDGGVGGTGGEGGLITLINKNSIKTSKGLTGATGQPGKGGAGGIGGRNGCFYEVFDVDDEILHRVTTVKCSPGNILPSGISGKKNYNTHGQIFPTTTKNLTVPECLNSFIKFSGSDTNVIMFLKELQHSYINQKNITNIINEYKIIKELDNVEFYKFFRDKISKYIEHPNNTVSSDLKYLKFIVLGRILLKRNVNFFFIDSKIFLNILKNGIKNSNILAVSYLNRKIETKFEILKENIKSIKIKLKDLSRHSEVKKDIKDLNKTQILCSTIIAVDVMNDLIRCSENLYSNCTQPLEYNATDVCYKNYDILSEFPIKKISLLDETQVRIILQKLKNFLGNLKESYMLLFQKSKLLEMLTDEVEHFIALQDFIEWKELEKLFLDLQNDKDRNLESKKNDIEFLKSELVNVLTSALHKLALDAVRQKLPPLVNLLTYLPKGVTPDDILGQINFLQDISNQETIAFCKNYVKAVFDKHSAVGEFYFWPNPDIRDELQKLFSGREINIKSNLINRHVYDKNFIQFTSLKLEFECVGSCDEDLFEILFDFKVEMIHSGYSYYNYKGDTYIVVSEKVTLDYSFKMRDSKEPEMYNAFYKKCQDGEIKLSPFTTWTIRLLPLNTEANFSKLSSFINTVNLRLIGTGTYIL